MKLPRWRKATWALVVWTVLIALWMIAGVAGNDCASEATDLNQSACEAGTGIGVAIIGLFGFFGFVFFSLVWFMSRPKNRQCPRCGNDVKKGVMICQSCGFDFSTVGQQAATDTGQPTA